MSEEMVRYFELVDALSGGTSPIVGRTSPMEYLVYGAIIFVLVVVIGAGMLFNEYGSELMVGLMLTFFMTIGVFTIGIFIGSVYFLFWLLEIFEAIEDNPIEYFIFSVLTEWINTIAMLDFVRIPMIYFEYLVTLLVGLKEYDPNNRTI